MGGEGLGGNARHFFGDVFFLMQRNYLTKSNKTVFDIKDITDVNQVSHVFLLLSFFLEASSIHSRYTKKIQLKMRDAEKAGSIFLEPKMLEINKWEDFVHQMRLPSRELTHDKFSKVVVDFSRIRGPKIIGRMLIFNLL